MFDLSAFKWKHVQGLYSFDHYQRESDGSWIQVSGCRDRFIYVDGASRAMTFHNSMDALVAHASSLSTPYHPY